MNTARTVGDFLSGPLAQRLAERQARQEALRPAWDRSVSPELARHSSPLKLEQGRLTVQADGPIWAHRLRTEGGKLLQRLQAEMAEPVSELAVRVVPPEVELIPSRASVMRELSVHSRLLIDDVAVNIGDEDLRRALRRLARATD
ncbi:MAG: DUF721 domain-containing protein [Acidiferrobacteraceae bacterium]|jgi:hypothetical protein